MKRLICCITIVLSFSAQALAATQSPLVGKVQDEDGAAIAYATVVALKDNRQITGTTTDEQGSFALRLDAGEYTLLTEFLGYEPDKRIINIGSGTDLGVITLRQSSVEIAGMAVTAQIIKREADRFVVDVANMASALGKDGVELLEAAPAVFINDDQISINGKSGTKVYVNDRELKYSKEQLIAYLRALKSEDIRTIEVVPQSGADYDADSAGGIIKITLKRRRDDGIIGNISFSTRQSDLIHNYVPSASINYHSGKWTLNASGWYSGSNQTTIVSEKTNYFAGDKQLTAGTTNRYNSQWGGANVGVIFDINNRHSLGAEVNYYDGGNIAPTASTTHLVAEQSVIDSRSNYRTRSNNRGVSATLNYIIKFDSLGSKLKILADYNYDSSHSNNGYRTLKDYMQGETLLRSVDSLYRDRSATDYNVTTVNIGYEKVFSPKITLKTGAKYTNNIMVSNATYHYRDENEQWIERSGYGYDERYTEHIAAAYITTNAKLGRWGLAAGLRGEYTHTSGRGNVVRQDYFSLFPNANVSVALKKDQSYSMVLQYARTIRRPNFWALNPERTQISEYSYQCGNPYLRPQFANDISLTFVMKYKYSITLGAILRTDELQQMIKSDAENPDINYIINENLRSSQNYYLTANLPFQLTKWWTLNLNATAIYNGVRIDNNSPQRYRFMANGNVQTTFTLPKKFFIDLSYHGMSNHYIANIVLRHSHRLNFTLKKRLLDNALTLSAGVHNIIPVKNTFVATTEAMSRTLNNRQPWSQPTFVFSASWSFNKGKQFAQKSIERGADQSRLSK